MMQEQQARERDRRNADQKIKALLGELEQVRQAHHIFAMRSSHASRHISRADQLAMAHLHTSQDQMHDDIVHARTHAFMPTADVEAHLARKI